MPAKIRIPIHHEQIILGTMLSVKEVRERLVKSLHPDDFIAPNHRAIFAELQELESRRLDYIPATLKTFLPPGDDWGGVEYLNKIETNCNEKNLDYHIERARWDRVRSGVMRDGIAEFESALKDPQLEVDEALSILNRIHDSISQVRDQRSVMSGATIVAKYMANLYARESGGHLCSSGYTALDKKLTNPFGRGLITIIAAAPSIGKTSFSLNMAYRQSAKWKVCYLAWESGSTAAVDILCASALGIKLETLVKYPHKIKAELKQRMTEVLDNVFLESGNGLIFLSRPPKSITAQANGPWDVNERIIDWFESQISNIKPDIVYWDLFEKMLPDRRPQAISWALDRVQEIAHTHNVHIALLHQVTFKEAEKKVDKRPSRGLLKGTGGYIEVPDMVFGLYRRAVYEPGIADNELELYCLKQRIGPWPWRLVFDWNGECTQVSGGRECQLTVTEDDIEETEI